MVQCDVREKMINENDLNKIKVNLKMYVVQDQVNLVDQGAPCGVDQGALPGVDFL